MPYSRTLKMNAIVDALRRNDKRIKIKYKIDDISSKEEFKLYPFEGLDANKINIGRYAIGVHCGIGHKEANTKFITISDNLNKLLRSMKNMITEEVSYLEECDIMALEEMKLISDSFPVKAVIEKRICLRDIIALVDDLEDKAKLKELFIRFNKLIEEYLDQQCAEFERGW